MGYTTTTDEMAENVKDIGATALAMTQGAIESDAVPQKGLWFVTRGAQILERENNGELAGATLWGLGKVVALEAPHLHPRMIDLDPRRDRLAVRPGQRPPLPRPGKPRRRTAWEPA